MGSGAGSDQLGTGVSKVGRFRPTTEICGKVSGAEHQCCKPGCCMRDFVEPGKCGCTFYQSNQECEVAVFSQYPIQELEVGGRVCFGQQNEIRLHITSDHCQHILKPRYGVQSIDPQHISDLIFASGLKPLQCRCSCVGLGALGYRILKIDDE